MRPPASHLQMGHSGRRADSHWSMHSMWKRCWHGSTRCLSPSLRHTERSSHADTECEPRRLHSTACSTVGCRRDTEWYATCSCNSFQMCKTLQVGTWLQLCAPHSLDGRPHMQLS